MGHGHENDGDHETQKPICERVNDLRKKTVRLPESFSEAPRYVQDLMKAQLDSIVQQNEIISELGSQTKELNNGRVRMERIEKQTIKTNGRVGKLEQWRTFILGAVGLLIILWTVFNNRLLLLLTDDDHTRTIVHQEIRECMSPTSSGKKP